MIIECVVILWAVFFDGMRDKINNQSNRWPNSGWRKEIRVFGFKKVWTLDKWHFVKWLSFYPPLVLLWSRLPPMAKLLLVPAAFIAWRLYPKPDHWQ